MARQRVRAHIADPGFRASDAAIAGAIAREQALVTEVAMAVPRDDADIRRKVELLSETYCDEGQPTKASAIILAAIVSDLRLIETCD